MCSDRGRARGPRRPASRGAQGGLAGTPKPECRRTPQAGARGQAWRRPRAWGRPWPSPPTSGRSPLGASAFVRVSLPSRGGHPWVGDVGLPACLCPTPGGPSSSRSGVPRSQPLQTRSSVRCRQAWGSDSRQCRGRWGCGAFWTAPAWRRPLSGLSPRRRAPRVAQRSEEVCLESHCRSFAFPGLASSRGGAWLKVMAGCLPGLLTEPRSSVSPAPPESRSQVGVSARRLPRSPDGPEHINTGILASLGGPS